MKHLFIALSTKGFGETILGIRVARELEQQGDRCFFLVHESAVPLLAASPFPHMKLTEHAMPLLGVTLQVLVRKVKPDSIVLSDYFTTALAFQRTGVNPELLREFGIPVCAIDTWDTRTCGTTIDVFGCEQRTFDNWMDLVDSSVIPVPIARALAAGDAPYYNGLPETTAVTRKIRRHIRRDFGIADDERAILFCTAAWQHAAFTSEAGNRLATMLPLLVASYLRQLGPRVHLVHVGPSAYSIDLGDRYHWVPPLPPDSFDPLLASVDVYLAANASSTTLAKAVVSGIPSVVFMNSRMLATADDLGVAGASAARAEMVAWANAAAPLYPFSMWPIGYYKFLKPMLERNEFCEVVPMLEILEPEKTVAALESLLFDQDRRDRHVARQAAYVEALGRLPMGGQLVGALTTR